jgi:uncharacterized RDD family membrane protein YckC
MYVLAVRDPVTDLVHRRTLAGWIDVLVLALVAIVISAASGEAHIGSWTSYDNGVAVMQHGFQFNLSGGDFLLWFVIALLYYGVDEALTGQTVGKRLFDLKVIRLDGHRLDPGSVALRTLGRVIDVLPAFYLLGWILMRGPRRPPQRLGDRIARTTVVRVSNAS